MDEKEIIKFVSGTLGKKRLKHTKGVVKAAEDLAKTHKVDLKSARIAAWLHDVAKEFSDSELREFCLANNIQIDGYIDKNIKLAHGLVGAYIARNKLNIKNEEIISSIENHTLGQSNMSNLEKIIYLSDIIEEGRRDYPGLSSLRKLSYSNLNEAMALALELSVLHLTKENKDIHPRIFKIKEEYKNYKREEYMDGEKKIQKIAEIAYNIIDNKTSMEVTALEVKDITTLAEIFVIAKAPNTSLVSSISEEIEKALAEEGFLCTNKEGKDTARWVLLDYQGVIIHIMHEEEAEFYKLDKLWSDGKKIDF